MKTLKLILAMSTTVIVGTSLLAASPSYGARLKTGGNPPSVVKKVKLPPIPPKFHPNKPSKSPGNSQAVPEPASVLGIMAFGALGGRQLLKRGRKGAV